MDLTIFFEHSINADAINFFWNKYIKANHNNTNSFGIYYTDESLYQSKINMWSGGRRKGGSGSVSESTSTSSSANANWSSWWVNGKCNTINGYGHHVYDIFSGKIIQSLTDSQNEQLKKLVAPVNVIKIVAPVNEIIFVQLQNFSNKLGKIKIKQNTFN